MTIILDKITNFLCKLRISKKVLAVLFVIAFLISLIPIVITAFYSVPTYDDYSLSYYSHKAVVDGTSLFGGIVTNCIELYNTWQGFMLSNFYPAIQPFVFDENLYFISCLFVIGILIFALLYFAKSILINTLKVNVFDYILISFPVTFLIIQFMPSVSEAFYWMDGSLTLVVNSIMLIILSFVTNYYNSTTKKKRVIYSLLAIIFMIFICTDSPLTFVTMMMIFAYVVVYMVYCNKKESLSTIRLIIILSIIYIVGLVIALIAPGNKVRLDSGMSDNSYSIISSIMYAVFYSVVYAGKWFNICFISVLIIVSAIFWNVAKNSKFSFKYPLLIFVLSYAVYAGRMSVQLAAGGYLGSDRQINQYYLGFVLAITFSWLYFVGWVSKKQISEAISFNAKKISVVFLMMTTFVFLCGCFNFRVKNIACVSTAISLYSGETQTYNKEMKERIALYKNYKICNVEVNEITYYPECFVAEPISIDTTYWTNRTVAKYYNKKSVKLVHSKDR